MSKVRRVLVALCTVSGCYDTCTDQTLCDDAGCADQWVCSGVATDTFEVRCAAGSAVDGGRACQCFKNGLPGNAAGSSAWCNPLGGPDLYERRLDANKACGWAIPYGG